MPVARSARIYPLVLKADPLNVGIVAAFDLAAEDGSTTADNGKDHSGNARHMVPFGATPPIVETAVGKGRDTSVGRTTSSAFYQADGAVSVGLAVGTGDFSIYKRIRTPSYAPATTSLREVGRITDGSGSKMTLYLYEVASTGGWHWQAGGMQWNTSGNPALAINTISCLHITRTAGVLKVYVDGVLRFTNNAHTVDFLSTTGTSKTVIGNFGMGDLHDAISIDEIYWNRGLTDGEVVAHAGNPYAYYDNITAADSITISTPSLGSAHGSDIAISGTYGGEGLPTAIEASFNGAAWTVIDSTLSGGMYSGVLSGQAAGNGTLSVRWANAPTVTASIGNVTVELASLSFTAPSTQLSALAYRTFQRDISGQASVRISGAYVGTPTALQYRWKGGAWATLDPAPAGGVFDKTVTLTGPGQGSLEVRFSNNTAVSASLAQVGVGDIYIVAGQSNHVGMSANAYVPTVAPSANPTWQSVLLGKDGVWKPHLETSTSRFDDRTNATYAAQVNSGVPSGSYFGALATKIMAGGVPVAFVPCALGSTSIANWAVNTATTSLYGAALARATEVGGYKAVLWWQGENETTGTSTKAEHVAALNALVNDWFTRTAKKWFVWAINAAGTGANFQAIHDAIIEVGQTNANVQGYADLNGSFTSSIHYGTLGEINEIAVRTFEALNTAYDYVAPPVDTTAPVLTGEITTSDITSSGFTFSCPLATGDVVGYESSIDGGVTWLDMETSRTRFVTGLLPLTSYATRWRAYDGASTRNLSAVLSLSIVTLSAESTASDTARPTMVGEITIDLATSTAIGISWQAATDNVGVVGYQYSTDGVTYTNTGTSRSAVIGGLTASSSYTFMVRAADAAGNISVPLTRVIATAEAPPPTLPSSTPAPTAASRSYAWLKDAMARWSHRDDLGPMFDDFVMLAEKRINGDIEARLQVAATTLDTISGLNAILVPPDVAEIRALSIAGIGSLDYVPPADFYERSAQNLTGEPRFFTVIGPYLYMDPMPNAVYSMACAYRQKIPSLLDAADGVNWLIRDNPDIYLAAVMCEAMNYIENLAKLPVWEAKYQEAVDSLNDIDWCHAPTLTIRSDSTIV